jgi:hypothetical protein
MHGCKILLARVDHIVRAPSVLQHLSELCKARTLRPKKDIKVDLELNVPVHLDSSDKEHLKWQESFYEQTQES